MRALENKTLNTVHSMRLCAIEASLSGAPKHFEAAKTIVVPKLWSEALQLHGV